MLTIFSQLNILYDFKAINLKKILKNKIFFIKWFNDYHININFDNPVIMFQILL